MTTAGPEQPLHPPVEPHPQGEGESRRRLDRVWALTDGTVAIAITLLVLPLVDAAANLG